MPEGNDRRRVRIGELARQVGLSVGWLRQLADAGAIPSERTAGGHRVFDVPAVADALARRRHSAPARRFEPVEEVEPEAPPSWSRTVGLAGAAEDAVWRELADDLALDSEAAAYRVIVYAFTEMLNNAIDHSGGTSADVRFWALPERLAFRITDDGDGVFAHMRAGLSLPDDFTAIQELTKGKRTTWPERHTGEGIFFTSKVVDLFRLSSGGLRWTVDNLRADHAVGQGPPGRGTQVYAEVSTATTRTPAEVFSQYTRDYEFTRTRPVVKLFGLGLTFVSRSEARRLLEGLDPFTEIEVDFTGVADVGQGFVDELFRVWPREHPGRMIVPTNMNPAVELMVKRGLARGAEAPGT